jgi:hypothetical protein
LVNRGGPSPEFELPLDFSDPEDDGVEDGVVVDGEAFPESGAVLAGVVFVGLCVSLGGWSAVSMCAGADSALSAFFAGSDPAARQTPVAIHGVGTLAELLCSAVPMVNNPSEFPDRSPSYTVPGSSAIGTGSALYALASQNLPLIMMAIGTSDTFPLASIRRTATARGPASFFRGTFLSPGIICGRSSWPPAATTKIKQASNAMTPAHNEILQCRILEIFGSMESAVAALPASEFVFSGEIPMKVNDKAPDFTLQDENEKEVALKDLRGKTVVLFFYPKANTPG